MKLAVFDVDGVLIDSLPAHLAFCQNLVEQYSLPLSIPDIVEFKRRLADGMQVSPMPQFFRGLGFPEQDLQIFIDHYKADFAKQYETPAYQGAFEMLHDLSKAGYGLGLITANIAENIIPALQDVYDLFEKNYCHFYSQAEPDVTKADVLTRYKHRIGAKNIVFVGDQYSDEKYAKQAEVDFIPVTYGWAFSELIDDPEHCHSINDLKRQLLSF